MKITSVLLTLIMLAVLISGCAYGSDDVSSNPESSAASVGEGSFASDESSVESTDESSLPEESDISAESSEIDPSIDSAGKDEYYDGYTGSKKEIVLKAEYGEEDGKIGLYLDGGVEYESAEYFTVEEDGIYILDSVGDNISVFGFDGEFEKKIGFECPDEIGKPIAFAKDGENYAVIVKKEYSVIESGETRPPEPDFAVIYIPETGDLQTFVIADDTEFPHPDIITLEGRKITITAPNSSVFYITVPESGDQLKIISDKSAMIEEGIKYATIDGNVIDVVEDSDWMSVENLGYDAEGNLYFYQSYKASGVRPSREESVTKYDTDGNQKEYAIIYNTKDITLPNRNFFVAPDGTLYYMSAEDDALYIYEVEMGYTAISQSDAK